MANQDPVWDRAEHDLVLTGDDGIRDVFLWEHCRRVARNARLIARLPGVPAPRVDGAALDAAALYHDAGWICQCREGTVDRFELLSKPTSDLQHSLAASLLTKALRDHLKPRSLSAAALFVRQMGDRHVRAVEAQILADADNLDEIGSLSLWNVVRRHTFQGKSVEAALQTWQRQREFRFWTARINNSLRFEAVKQIAFKRLEELDRFMELLARHHRGDDLLEHLERNSLPVSQGPPE